MPKASSSQQARRLLALVGLLTPDTQVPLADLASALGVPVHQVAADLELLSLCGVAPYSPGDLVPLYVENGHVIVFGTMPALDRKVRLSPAEARALAAALQAAGRTADDPLVGRLLEAASETDPHDIERTIRATAASDTGHQATLALAARRNESVRIRYQTAGTEEVAERVIEPLELLNERGVWYVEAFCRRAGAVRTFRVDRVQEAVLTGETFRATDAATTGTARPTGVLSRATVLFDRGTDVSEREWPGLRVVSENDAGTVAEVPYAGTAWIARQVASLLGAAEVLGPPEVRDAVARLATSEQ